MTKFEKIGTIISLARIYGVEDELQFEEYVSDLENLSDYELGVQLKIMQDLTEGVA